MPAEISRGAKDFLEYAPKSQAVASARRSMSSWKSSQAFLARESKNFMPLSEYGLWEAVIIAPRAALRSNTA